MKKTVIIFLTLLCAACASRDKVLPAVNSDKFVMVNGTQLVLPNGNPLLIRGVAFGNSVWSNPPDPDGFMHHEMKDYENIKSMGFNAVRFYLNYGLFENDFPAYTYKNSGFEWLYRNIEAAREAGIYLVLNMHYPQGGFQSNGNGDALWTDPKNRKRLAALWKVLARFTRDEEQIIGFGLVNEPVPVDGMKQWTALAQELIDSIREVDENHLIFLERPIWIKHGTTRDDEQNLMFPCNVTDPQNRLVLEFHMYEPFGFTHQNASWTSQKGQYARYPDKTRNDVINRTWAGMSHGNPLVPQGDFDWTFFEGKPAGNDDTEILALYPVVQVRKLGKDGKIWADDISVDEYDESGNYLGKAWTSSIDSDRGWSFWAVNGQGNISTDSSQGHSGGASMLLAGTSADANATYHQNGIIITPGHSYKISGWLRAANAAKNADITLRLDFYKGDGVSVWDRQSLSEYLDRYAQYGKERNIPVYLGEFGAIRYCFEEDRGGLRWAEDMLDLLSEKGIHYNYHAYHEFSFGIYYNNKGYPDPTQANDGLIALFRKKQLK
ncbi:MAG: cellulase family glycosylhydrolase [Spirochaetales bacterium]|nr:cellulase family glycosylhydrolase [Spirochaetales bacterium]